MTNFLIGADPELFIKDKKTGNFLSAHDCLVGDKDSPYFVGDGAVQVDGVAAEFNIKPASNKEEFLSFIKSTRSFMESYIQETHPDAFLTATPTATFTEEYFNNLPPEAVLLGCMPDFNAYSMKQNTPPETKEPFRTGGGHIHIGLGDVYDINNATHFENCAKIIRNLDCTLFVPSLVWDTDKKRRTLYGQMGAFRPKSYGVEYRPLSNAFLDSDPIIELIYNNTIKTMDYYTQGVNLWDDAPYSPETFLGDVSEDKVKDHITYLEQKGFENVFSKVSNQ